MNKLQSIIDELTIIQADYNHIKTEYDKLQNIFNDNTQVINNLSTENISLKSTVQSLKDEINNLKRIGIVTNLNKQVNEKDNYIAVLEKRIDALNNRNKPEKIIEPVNNENNDIDVSTDKDDENNEIEIEDDVSAEEEPEIKYESIKIGKKYYYISNEEPEYVYEVVKGSNDVGQRLGKYNRETNMIEKQ